MKKEKLLTNIAIAYFIIGLIFAILFALYYKWEATSFFSFNFYSVVFTWPIQLIGFISDLSYYGLSGKPI